MSSCRGRDFLLLPACVAFAAFLPQCSLTQDNKPSNIIESESVFEEVLRSYAVISVASRRIFPHTKSYEEQWIQFIFGPRASPSFGDSDPRDGTVSASQFNNLGFAYMRSEDYDSAVLAFSQAIHKNKHYLNAIFNRCVAKYCSGNQTWRADSQIVFALAQERPRDIRRLLYVGFTALLLRDLPAALHEFDELLRQNPLLPIGHFLRSIAKSLSGDTNGADRDFELYKLLRASDRGTMP